MTTLEEKLAEDRRGAVLRILHDQGDYAINDGVLQDALELIRHNVTRDLIRDDLTWLKERQLVQVEVIHNVWCASIATRGTDFMKGRIKGGIPGLKRHTG